MLTRSIHPVLHRLVACLVACFCAMPAPSRAADAADSLSAGQGGQGGDQILSIPAGAAELRDSPDITRICMCLQGRLTIRKADPDFLPVAWELRRLDGALVPLPQGQASGTEMVFDLSRQRKGVYVVAVIDKAGNRMARPIRID